jgi:hypothetical protein
VNAFNTEKFIPISVADLEPVAQELAGHFKQRNYQVECSPLPDGEWQVGITRGGAFKTALGLKSALKVQIEPRSTGTMVKAGAGIFGKQAVPTAIMLFVAWPVLLTQVWGLIREAGLDDEAVRVVETILTRVQRSGSFSDAGSTSGPGAAQPVDDGSSFDLGTADAASAPSGASEATSPGGFCTSCGTPMDDSARFCSACGHARAS